MRYPESMGATVRIEIDKHTADMLQSRASELGVTIQQLVAELATLDSAARGADASEIAELDRRYASAEGAERVPHERVVQWLRTWGTSEFRPWPGQ
jgi:predicted transcriptional regulator